MRLYDRMSYSKIINENTSPHDQMKERLTWDNMKTNPDKFSILRRKLENMEQEKTKREALATLTSIFDPFGMITPVTLKMDMFVQEFGKRKKKIEERRSSEEITTWKGIMTDLDGIPSIHLPRSVGKGSSLLLGFCDYSSKAYATKTYLHTIKNDKIAVRLTFLRQEIHRRRNPPSQVQNRCSYWLVHGAYVLKLKKQDESMLKVCFGQISQFVLQWIKNRDRTSFFVKNQITEIIN